MNRKKFLIVGGILIAGTLAIVVTSLFTRGSGSVCEDFIATIEEGDVQKSYAMFTVDAQATTSFKSWEKSVNSIYEYYNNVKPELKKTDSITDPSTGEVQVVNTYTIKAPSITYNVVCYTTADESEITAFTSDSE